MKIKWQPIVKIDASLLFQWYWIKGSLEETPTSLDINFRYKNNKIVSGEISIDINEAIEIENILRNKIQKGCVYLYLKDYIVRCYKFSDQLLETSRKVGNGDLTKLSNRKLLSLYLDYQRKVLKLMPFLNTILVLDEVLKKEIIKLLDVELGINKKEDQDILLSKLVIPKKKNFFVEETDSLMNMALKLQNDSKLNIEKDIKVHLEKFTWSSSISYLGDFQTEDDVRKKVAELVEEDPAQKLKDRVLITENAKRNFEESYRKIEKSKSIQKLIDYAREFIFLQTYRLDVFFLAHYYAYPLLKEIGNRAGTTVNDLVFLTGDEIVNLLRKNKAINKQEVNQRKKNYALILERGEWSLFSGSKVKKTGATKINETIVRGTVASRGRATGLAKLVFGVDDIQKVIKGNIIVSPMTRPEYTSAIIKSSGIITDFGGMLSHAAIISREFGIPCIVGTKNATKVFQDGDLVELNAYEGIARKN